MKIGVQCYFSGPSATGSAIAEAAQVAEQAGFHSLWVGEHVVLFDEYAARYPYAANGRYPLADVDGVPVEPFVALTYAAAVTRRIRLGTGVLLIPQRNPLYTAKSVRDLDALSDGRFDFGVGVGWCQEEFEALGVPFERRGARADEYIALMKALWTEREVTHEGRFYTACKVVQGPRTVQQPHPPVLVGGETDAAIRRAARNDGWYTFDRTPEQLEPDLRKLDGYLREAGQARDNFQVIVCPFSHPCDLELLKRYQDLGVDQVVVFAFTLDPARIRDEIAGLGERLVQPAASL